MRGNGRVYIQSNLGFPERALTEDLALEFDSNSV